MLKTPCMDSQFDYEQWMNEWMIYEAPRFKAPQ